MATGGFDSDVDDETDPVVSCKYCGRRGRYEEIERSHLLTCPKFPMTCPNNCNSSQTIQRKNLASHIQERCRLAEPCFFEFAGCRHKVSKEDEIQHDEDNVSLHLQLVIEAYLTLKNEVDEKDKKLETLKTELMTLEREEEDSKKDGNTYPPVAIIMPETQSKQPGEKWYSEPFYSHPGGYKMCLSVYAKGIGPGKGTHVSVFANLMKGDFDDKLKWPFFGEVFVKLVVGEMTFRKPLRFMSKSPQWATGQVLRGRAHSVGQGDAEFVKLNDVEHRSSLHFVVEKLNIR